MRSFRNFLACFAFISFPVFANPILQIQNGELRGVQNIEVNDTLYNVHFQIGSCNELFDNCTQSVFGSLDGEIVGTDHSGVFGAASQATWALKKVLETFVNSGEIYEFKWSDVRVVTPFRARGDLFIRPSMDTFMSISYLDGRFTYGDGSVANDYVMKYAIWEVPEPSNVILLGIGLSGLLLRRRKLVHQ